MINKYEQINKKTVYFKRFSEYNVNFMMDVLVNSGKCKSRHVFQMEYNLNHKFYFLFSMITTNRYYTKNIEKHCSK